jgi:hypothetical protein
LVRHALVVSARRHRQHASGHGSRRDADDARGLDSSTAGDAGRHGATSASGGHVFCLTLQQMMIARRARRLLEPLARAQRM